jgi:class 3 adenylate cyclase/CheY-like chemotaxis protein
MINAGFSHKIESPPLILIVDDEETQQLFMRRVMEKEGYQVIEASQGQACLELCQQHSPDIILLDAMMPVMDGFECCLQLKSNPATQQIPVLMITALDDKKSVNRAFDVGATDYVTKPIHWAVLIQRVRRLIEQSRLYKQLVESQAKTENLLLNILPKPIAKRLQDGESKIADRFDNVSVLFADIVGFTSLAARISPEQLIDTLNSVFSKFDRLTEQYQLEKIKTLGDGYMVALGLPIPNHHGVDLIVKMAIAMQAAMTKLNRQMKFSLALRIGIHTGPVIAGVIGIKKFTYDLWGDTVNIASRMEQHGIPNCIQITEATYRQLSDRHGFEERGAIDIKGKGKMKTYLLDCSESIESLSELKVASF